MFEEYRVLQEMLVTDGLTDARMDFKDDSPYISFEHETRAFVAGDIRFLMHELWFYSRTLHIPFVNDV